MIKIALVNADQFEAFFTADDSSDVIVSRISADNVRYELGSFNADIVVCEERLVPEVSRHISEEKHVSIFIAVPETATELPKLFLEGQADEILTYPPRRPEVLSKVKWHYHIRSLKEIEGETHNMKVLVDRLKEDIQLAEKVQRRLIKEKFPTIGGVSIKSKYFSGLASGGDYFDVYDFKEANRTGIILMNASSYSLSSSFLSALLGIQLEENEKTNPYHAVQKLYDKIYSDLQPADRLSLFVGYIDQKTYELQYSSFGEIWGAVSRGSSIEWLCRAENAALSANFGPGDASQSEPAEVLLEPGQRLSLYTNGAAEILGQERFLQLAEDEFKTLDAQAALNNFGHALRAECDRGNTTDDRRIFARDCSILHFDVAKNVLRLAT